MTCTEKHPATPKGTLARKAPVHLPTPCTGKGRVFNFPAASNLWMTGTPLILLKSSSQAAQHLLCSKQLQHAVFVVQLMGMARRSESPESTGWGWRTIKWGHSEEALEMQDTTP